MVRLIEGDWRLRVILFEDQLEGYSPPEERYEEYLFNHLVAEGLIVERQKEINQGVIDIFVYGAPPAIIEIKTLATAKHVKMAMAQIEWASQFYPNAEKILASPEYVNKDLREFLGKYSIEVMVLPAFNIEYVRVSNDEKHFIKEGIQKGIIKDWWHGWEILHEKGGFR